MRKQAKYLIDKPALFAKYTGVVTHQAKILAGKPGGDYVDLRQTRDSANICLKLHARERFQEHMLSSRLNLAQ